MDTHWIWWLLAVLVVAAELATGTIYLLMLALGLAAGGVAAVLGLSSSAQLLVAAVVTGLGCFAVQRRKAKQPPMPQSERNADVHIDLGNAVQVDAWRADNTASVSYRGAQWQAQLDAGVDLGLALKPEAGKYRIVAMSGSTLVLAP